ncbi:MAG: DUF4115 domain-containing protein [Proteobacteria bacterium]|nr:DUF4115 domain-containing protein [Pseudomonadota bacterium]
MAEVESNPEIEEQGKPSASGILVAARQKSGMSQKEVADQLYLTVSCIRHIDEGAFDKIAKPAFIKGYLRSYARVVRADGDEIVGRYDSALQVAEQNIKIRDVTEETVGSANFTGPVLQTGMIGLVGVFMVVAVVWWVASDREDEDMMVTVAGVSEVASGPAAEDIVASEPAEFNFVFLDKEITGSGGNDDQAMADATGQTASGIMAVSGEGRATVEYSGNSDAAIERASLLRDVNIERNSDGGINYITLDAGGFDEIQLTFSDECWVEIEDGDGTSIYGDLNKSGDVLTIYGTAPFNMLFGRATAVTVVFNGEPVDVKEFITDDETAKVRLGR